MKDLVEEVRKILRRNNWLVLTTIDISSTPHSSVVVYQSDGYVIYCLTGSNTLKARNIKKNKLVSVTIPFRKNFLHKIVSAPPAELYFTTEASIRPSDDEEARIIYDKYLKYQEKSGIQEDYIWIKISLPKRIKTYGVGVKLWKMRKPEETRNTIELN